MGIHIKSPTVVKSAGNKVKMIEEFVGLVNSNASDISIAHMISPSGWEEPAQTPEFDEYTFVIAGEVHIQIESKTNIQNHPSTLLIRGCETSSGSSESEVHKKVGTQTYIIRKNELFIAKRGERIQYSTPGEQGAEYIAICLPAFSPEKVNREEYK